MKKHKAIAKYHRQRNQDYYHSESAFAPILRHFLAWFSVLAMGILALFLFKRGDVNIPQKEVTINVKLEDNSINICTPDEEK